MICNGENIPHQSKHQNLQEAARFIHEQGEFFTKIVHSSWWTDLFWGKVWCVAESFFPNTNHVLWRCNTPNATLSIPPSLTWDRKNTIPSRYIETQKNKIGPYNTQKACQTLQRYASSPTPANRLISFTDETSSWTIRRCASSPILPIYYKP